MNGRSPDAAPALVRLSLLTGVLLFGAVSWFTHRQPGWTPQAADVRPYRTLGYLVWGLGVLGVVALWVSTSRTRDPARLRALNLMAWACGEAPALFGGVVYFATGDVSWYLLGLAFMVGTLLAFPIRRG